MRISKDEAVKQLLSMDNILILAHENPDGDAVGSASALCRGLRASGKNAYVSIEPTTIGKSYLTEGLTMPENFRPDYIVAVDTADRKILGTAGSGYDKDCKVDLCIDHHISNVLYAEKTYLDENAAAAAEAVNDVLNGLGVTLTKDIAEAIYVGISTDTGCFRYANTTSKTLRMAADMVDTGINTAEINKVQFETKSKAYAAIEKMAIASMETFLDGKCAIITVTNEMFKESGVLEGETTPLASITRQIEGVLVGITLKEKEPGKFNISIRTNGTANAAAIAAEVGGGGHKQAAGCTVYGSKDEVTDKLLGITKKMLEDSDLL